MTAAEIRQIFLDYFAHHFLPINPHAEIGDRSTLGHRESVKRFHLPLLSVVEDLCDARDSNSVVDSDVYVVLFEFERAAEAAVGDEQTGGCDTLAG